MIRRIRVAWCDVLRVLEIEKIVIHSKRTTKFEVVLVKDLWPEANYQLLPENVIYFSYISGVQMVSTSEIYSSYMQSNSMQTVRTRNLAKKSTIHTKISIDNQIRLSLLEG